MYPCLVILLQLFVEDMRVRTHNISERIREGYHHFEFLGGQPGAVTFLFHLVHHKYMNDA